MFPLPRFPLGISDIAGAIRRNFIGHVTLSDMQLDESFDSIIQDISSQRYDIIGISATFGQQDLLENLIYAIQHKSSCSPLIVVGGSLAALNYLHIVNTFPNTLVSLGYGESTMQDIISYWHGMMDKRAINHIAYLDGETVRTTNKYKDDKFLAVIPELDLLDKTLQLNGVMQLESSRGCTYRCSFCPRQHKGEWSPETGHDIGNILDFIDEVFSRYSHISKKIFLVDEEFIGYSNDNQLTENRALFIANSLYQKGFSFESSTRIDQVIRPRQDRNWHIQRINFWKALKEKGLSRMLFGMESGVNSILKRFNKQTTAEQNILAVRLLTLLDIPLRLTYITFDPLMSMEELSDSFYFLGRKDVLMHPQLAMDNGQLFDDLTNEAFIAAKSLQIPLFTEISYMLVSMESLVGSPYLKMVEDAGLAMDYSLSMGRRNAKYIDEHIGLMSELSQRWIDRNFPLDYTLKSMIKISDVGTAAFIKKYRKILKDHSYTFLAKMLTVINRSEEYIHYAGVPYGKSIAGFLSNYDAATNLDLRKEILYQLMDQHIEELSNHMSISFEAIHKILPKEQARHIYVQLEKWKQSNDWELINI